MAGGAVISPRNAWRLRHRANRLRARAAEQERLSAARGIGWPLRRVYEGSASSLAAEADRIDAMLERAQ